RKDPECDFVIIDEAHTQYDKLHARIHSPDWEKRIVIGLSATPWSKGLGFVYSKLIVAATTAELIEEGYLSKFLTLTGKVEPDLSEVSTVAGEYNEGELADVMGQKKIMADVVKTYLEKGQGRKGFIFAVDRKHAQALQSDFKDAGVACGYIDCHTDDDERLELFKKYRNDEYRLIASVGCLTTGIDEDVRVIIMARPTKSEILWVQMIGRGLRLAPPGSSPKDHCLILDHASNTLELGEVTDVHHDELDKTPKGEKKKKEIKKKPKLRKDRKS